MSVKGYENVMGELNFMGSVGEFTVRHDDRFDSVEVDILMAGQIWCILRKDQAAELLAELRKIEGRMGEGK